MELLKRAVLAGLWLGLVPVAVWAEDPAPWCPYTDITFSGYVQGRLTGFAVNTEIPSGPLNDADALAGGQAGTNVYLQRLYVQFSTPLYFSQGSFQVSALLTVPGSTLQDAYMLWQASDVVDFKVGRFRVPFGVEPQTPSDQLDTVERALIYGFGNFGWVGPLGFGVVSERDYGVKMDAQWPELFASFAPSFRAAVVTGSGYNVTTSGPTQVMARLAADSKLEIEDFRNELSLGISGSYGWNHFLVSTSDYLPIGYPGNFADRPDAVQTQQSLGGQGSTGILGLDCMTRMNDLVVKAEWVLSMVDGANQTRGYYITGLFDFDHYGLPGFSLVGRWEEAAREYADGVHAAGTDYQAATAGINWKASSSWKLQADYIALFIRDLPHQFTGSDLIIGQLQFSF